MSTFTRYAARTGRVTDILDLPPTLEAFDAHNTLLYEGEIDGELQYFVAGVPIDRPTQSSSIDKAAISADGVDVATMTGLPTDCRVTIAGPTDGALDVADGTLEFRSDVPGDYVLTVTCFPYLSVAFDVSAV